MEPVEDDILDVSGFSFEGDFETQVEEILTRVRLSRFQVEFLQSLLDDLTQALWNVWPGCQVYPFGSIVTGLGIKTSDIDCFIKINPHFLQSEINPVMHAKHALRQLPYKFAELFAIHSAKVPILKFRHLPTNFQCDINFTSFAGVRNSQLIAFMLNMDSRAFKLAIIVKYWSKVYDLTGTNLLPNYALTMMVIFYLQVASVLPAVEELQRRAQSYFIEDWNTSFDGNMVYSINNNDSLYDFLCGFFNYYANFDFDKYIISPYMGIPLKKELFVNLYSVPNEFHLYKDNVTKGISQPIRLESSICVQDPFDHSRNCTVAVFGKLLSRIKSCFQLAVSAYNKNVENEFLRELFSMAPKMFTEECAVPHVRRRPPFTRKNKNISREKKNKSAKNYRTKRNMLNWYHETSNLFKGMKKPGLKK